MVYNPSNWNQRVLLCFIAFPAVVIAVYLSLFQWGLITHVWDPFFGNQSEHVLTSNVSHQFTRWIRIPDAMLGAVSYVGDILFSLAGSDQRWQDRPWLVLIFAIDVILLGVVSIILVALQGTVVGSWCFLCLVSACISLILIFLSYSEVKASLIFLFRLWKKTKNKKILWNTFWGTPSKIAYETGLEIIKERSYVGSHR